MNKKKSSADSGCGRFNERELFDYVHGLLPTERTAEIEGAAIEDEELAARIQFMQALNPEADSEDIR